MKTTTNGELTAEEVKEAVIFWLKEKKKIDAESIYFRVDGVEDPDDWHARNALSYELTKAFFTVKDTK